VGKAGGKGTTPSFPRKRESTFIALMQGAMGLGRKDGNTGSCHKNGWIPAFAGMTGWASAMGNSEQLPRSS